MRIWLEFDRKLLKKNSFFICLFGYSKRTYHLIRQTEILITNKRKIQGPFKAIRFVFLNLVLCFDTGPKLRVVKRGRKKAGRIRKPGVIQSPDGSGKDLGSTPRICTPFSPK
jgi:hypothetical protein